MSTIIVDTERIQLPERTDCWEENRRGYYDAEGVYEHEVSIVVPAFNRLEEKTKVCIESILKYTKGIDYELILVDDCSSDGTMEYFESVPYEPKVVIHMTKNMGQAYGLYTARRYARGKFRVFAANDCIMTKNWLSNLLICIKSDPRIGMVVPGCSNVSNAQEMSLGHFENWDEMQRLAAKHNVSNPDLWEERPRLVNPTCLYRAEIFDSIGYFDPGFSLNFIEDNIARSIHRAGYKLILCNDTYIEHNHPQTERPSDLYKKNLDEGRKCFVEKFKGIDPWDDVNNYVNPYLDEMELTDLIREEKGTLSVLGVNIRCGTPFLDIRNKARKSGIKEVEFFAFTSDLKYYPDLVAYPANVINGETFEIDRYYSERSFDVAVTTEDVSDEGFLNKLCVFVKAGGYLLFPVKNPRSILYYIDSMLGRDGCDKGTDEIGIDQALEILDKNSADRVFIYDECYQEQLKDTLIQGVGDSIFKYIEEVGDNTDGIFVERYWIMAKM